MSLWEKCPVNECFQRVPPSRVFCDFHWRMCPKDVQQAFWRDFHAGTERYMAKSADAVRAVGKAVAAAVRAKKAERQVIHLPVTTRVISAPTPDSPAVGVHYSIDGRYGFIPPPPWEGRGMCWECGRDKIAPRFPPLCAGCGKALWGEKIFEPGAAASRAFAGVTRRFPVR